MYMHHLRLCSQTDSLSIKNKLKLNLDEKRLFEISQLFESTLLIFTNFFSIIMFTIHSVASTQNLLYLSVKRVCGPTTNTCKKLAVYNGEQLLLFDTIKSRELPFSAALLFDSECYWSASPS